MLNFTIQIGLFELFYIFYRLFCIPDLIHVKLPFNFIFGYRLVILSFKPFNNRFFIGLI